MDPLVARFYEATRPFELTVGASFFETEGWTADKRFYAGKFNPTRWWHNKAKGVVYIKFEDDARKTKCTLSELIKHNLKILILDSSDEDEDADSYERTDEFNVHMRHCFRAGWLGTADETGPMWHGGEGEGDFNMCPHVSFV